MLEVTRPARTVHRLILHSTRLSVQSSSSVWVVGVSLKRPNLNSRGLWLWLRTPGRSTSRKTCKRCISPLVNKQKQKLSTDNSRIGMWLTYLCGCMWAESRSMVVSPACRTDNDYLSKSLSSVTVREIIKQKVCCAVTWLSLRCDQFCLTFDRNDVNHLCMSGVIYSVVDMAVAVCIRWRTFNFQ